MSTLVVLAITVVLFLSPAHSAGPRLRIYIVDSYHPEYLWSQDTAQGVEQGLLDFKFLDNERQAREFNARYSVESSKAVIKKVWMDTKRKSSKPEIADATARIVNEIRVFKPDLLLLGDDNASNYIGNHFIDTEIPVVFWGINGLPGKYGLIDSLEKPGHNVTGVYQAGYIKESIEALKKLLPDIKTMAVLSDDSETARAKAKDLMALSAAGALPVNISEVVITNSYAYWQEAAQRLAGQVDAFFICNHNTLKTEEGKTVDQLEVGAWYLENIKKPDCANEKQFVLEGILLVVDDSGYKQGYEAIRITNDILRKGKTPADYAVQATSRGAIILNRQRAADLGLFIGEPDFIEEYIDHSMALKNNSRSKTSNR